jgi:hypothetical protein
MTILSLSSPRRGVVTSLVVLSVLGGGAPTVFAVGVRFELRVVPQTGVLPDPVVDLAGNKHNPIIATDVSTTERTRRFEVQYRLIDTDLTDSIVPAGLFASDIRIVATSTGTTTGSVSQRAPLSQFEARVADFNPPGPVDSSGLPTIGGPFTGIHHPFRGGISSDNSNVNGQFTGLSIRFSPICGISNDQGSPEFGLTGTEWYGLYSFTFRAGSTANGSVTFTPVPIADPITLNAFGYWSTEGSFSTAGTNQFSSTGAIVEFASIPAPGSAALLVAVGAVRRKRH